MHLVIFGLTLSSSWGNGHATLWRGLLKALASRGHTASSLRKMSLLPRLAGRLAATRKRTALPVCRLRRRAFHGQA